ncbi:MAG: hypothetical protein CR988_01810 [Treponema sp.]|nr:MAG: hypothetical protein CR988_01810 [Treponema sp.]
MEWLKLLGILIIVVGFYFRLDVLAVVVISAIVTGLISGLGFGGVLEIMGKSFVNTRLMSIFFLSFPVIAMLERHGLKERSAELIQSLKKSTAGKILGLYTFIRTIAAAFSLRIGGHVQFIRPLIFPMAEAAAKNAKDADLSEDETEELKGLSAAVENYGNFFGQNIFVGASGVLLIYSTLETAGYKTDVTQIAKWSIPVGIIVVLLSFVQAYMYDRKIKKSKEAK